MPTSQDHGEEQGEAPQADGAASDATASNNTSHSSACPYPYDVTMNFKPINDPAACRPWLYYPYDVTKNFTPVNKPKVAGEQSSAGEEDEPALREEAKSLGQKKSRCRSELEGHQGN